MCAIISFSRRSVNLNLFIGMCVKFSVNITLCAGTFFAHIFHYSTSTLQAVVLFSFIVTFCCLEHINFSQIRPRQTIQVNLNAAFTISSS